MDGLICFDSLQYWQWQWLHLLLRGRISVSLPGKHFAGVEGAGGGQAGDENNVWTSQTG